MNDKDLIVALSRLQVETGSLACLGCGHEHNCGMNGCAIIREAIGRIIDTRWVPVKDELPVTEERVLCCTQSKTGNKNIVIGYYMNGMWRCGMNSNVVAWMPLPEEPKE